MKSLEIVNEMVDYWESAVNVACQSNAENGYYDELDIVEYQNRLKKYQQIKQDLEVLEIIKNKKVDIGFLKSILQDYSNEEALEIYNDSGYRKLTMEELLKLKQWLEENKDENI
jgi:hypothetical protein